MRRCDLNHEVVIRRVSQQPEDIAPPDQRPDVHVERADGLCSFYRSSVFNRLFKMLWASVWWKPAMTTSVLIHGKSACFRQEKARLVVICLNKVQYYDVSDSQLPFITIPIPALNSKAFCVCCVPATEDNIAVGTENGVQILRKRLEQRGSRTWDVTKLPNVQGIVDCIDFHPSGKYFIAAGPSIAGFYIWDLIMNDYRQITTGINRVTSLSYSPCGNYIAIISDQCWLMIYDTMHWTNVRLGTKNSMEQVVSFAWSMPKMKRTLLIVALADNPYLKLCEVTMKFNEVSLSHASLTTASQYLWTNHQGRTVLCVKNLCWDVYGTRLVVLIDNPHPNVGQMAVFQTSLSEGFVFLGYIELAWTVELRFQPFYVSVTHRYSGRKKEVIFGLYVNGDVAILSLPLDSTEKHELCGPTYRFLSI